MTDFDLLHQYASQRSEGAFGTLVEKYGNLVYSAALRQTRRPQDAEDITQVVFIILARKAAVLPSGTLLAGWLLRTTRHVVLNAHRRESRRWRTELDAMELYQTETQTAWNQIAPILDEALVSLNDKDRDAVALRFLEQKSFREIAQLLRTSEDAAQKRVSRALEKLRSKFTKRGVVVPAALAAAALSSKAVQAMPPQFLAALASKTAPGAATAASVAQLAESSLSALARARAKKLALRSGVAVLLVLLATFAVRQLKSPTPGSVSLAPSTRGVQSQPPQPLPGNTASTRPPLGLGTLLLRVVDSQRLEPIANAQLLSISATTNLLRTDPAGTAVVSFAGTKEGLWSWRIEILKDGYEPKFVNWGAVRGDTFEDMPREYTVRLQPGHIIGGVVTDPTGMPISGVQVLITDVSTPEGFAGWEGRREGLALTHVETTDSEGRWMCNHAPDRLEIVAFTLSHPDCITASYRPVTLRPAGDAVMSQVSEDDLRNQRATMILKLGLVVSGTVTDETGKPIPGAKVTENRAWSDPLANQATGPDGAFQFGNVAPGKLILTAQAPGYVGDDMTLHPSGPVGDVHFLLKNAGVLRGRVVDEKGEPVAGAGVTALGAQFEPGRFQNRVFTDEQGRFEWLSAPISERLYSIWAAGYKMADPIELNPDGSDQLVTLSKSKDLRPPSRIMGTVVDARTGRPVEQFQVWAAETRRLNGNSRFPQSRGLAPELRTTGLHGKFSFLELDESPEPLAKLDLEIKADGYLSAECTLHAPLGDGCQVTLRADPFVTLTGTVQTPKGDPAVSAQVLFCARSGTLLDALHNEHAYMSIPGQVDMHVTRAVSTLTDSKGQFVLEPKAATGTLLALDKSGYAEVPIDGPFNARVVRLEPWGAISGTLRVLGRPAVGKGVSLNNIASGQPPALIPFLTAMTDSTGHFFFQTVPPGRWMLSPHSVQVQVQPGKTAEVQLGGDGRKVIGKFYCKDPNLAVSWTNYMISLVTGLPGPPAPNREEFASKPEFFAAENAWWGRRIDYLHTPEGKAAQRNSRWYSSFLASDGTFSFREVLPGTYELSFSQRPPLAPDQNIPPLSGPFHRRVNVPAPTPDEEPVLNLGEFEVSKP